MYALTDEKGGHWKDKDNAILEVRPDGRRAIRFRPVSALIAAYKEFEDRVGTITTARGAKREMVQNAVMRLPPRFRLGDLQQACPGVSYPTLKRALADLQREKRIRCLGKGRDAEWERIGSWSH